MITIELVLAIHETILDTEPGLKGQPCNFSCSHSRFNRK